MMRSMALKNQAVRRVLSLVLALCMTLSLMPTFTFGADNVEPTIQSYEWRIVSPYQRRGTDTSIKQHADYALNQVTSYDMIDTFESQISSGKYDTVEGRLTTSADWMYGGESGEAGTTVFTDEDGGVLLSNVGDWISFLIKVDATGNYDLSARLRFNNTCGGITEIYLAPKGEVSAASDTIASKYLIATVDQYLNRTGASGDSSVPLTSNTLLSAGEYYVTYKVARASGTTDVSTYIQNFKIVPHDAETKSNAPVITPDETEFSDSVDVVIDAANQVTTSTLSKSRAFYKTGVDSYWENPSATIRMSTVPMQSTRPVSAIALTLSETTKISAVATDYIGRNGASSFKAPSESVTVTYTMKKYISPEIPRSLVFDFKKANIGDTSAEYVSGITYEMTDYTSETVIDNDIKSDAWAYGAGGLKYAVKNAGLTVNGTARIKVKVAKPGEYLPELRFESFGNADITAKLYSASTVIAEKTIAVDTEGDTAICDEMLSFAEGEYTLEITADAAVLNALVFNLKPYDLHYDFLKGHTQNFGFEYVNTITYEMTTEGSRDEVNRDIKSHPWEFHSKDVIGGNNYLAYAWADAGIALYAVSTHFGYGAFKIQVPAKGPYLPYVTLDKYTTGPAVIKLSKLNEDGSIGDVIVQNTINMKKEGDYALSDMPVELDEGEYVVTLTGAAGKCFYVMNGFKLKSTYGISSFLRLASDGIATMDLGKSTTLPISVTMTDESEINWDATTLDISFGNDNIASAEVSEDKSAITFTGLSVGKTTATIKVTNGETEAVRDVNIIVNEEGYSDTVRDLYYNFIKGNTGDTTITWPPQITYSMTSVGSADELNTAISSDPWAFHSTNSTGGNNYFMYYNQNTGLTKSQTGFGALKIKVPTDGNYQPIAVIAAGATLPVTAGIYKIKDDGSIGDAIVERADIETSATVVKDYAICEDMVALTAGEYIVKFEINGNSGFTIINGFKLINLDKKLSFAASTLSVIKGEQNKITLDITDYEGNKIGANDATFEMTVADASIATVQIAAEGEEIVVSAEGLKIGSTTATVTVSTSDGKNGVLELPISVTADFDLVIDMPIDEMVEYNKDTVIPISVRAKDVKTGEDRGEVAATISATATGSALGATVNYGAGNIGNSLVLTGNELGTSKLAVRITVGEVTKTYVYPMLIYSDAVNTENSYNYVIMKSLPRGSEISVVDNYFKIMHGTGETLRQNDTDTWCYYGQSEDSIFENRYDYYGAALGSGKGSWGAIKVRLPERGTYQILSKGPKYPAAAIMRVYIAPDDAENPRDAKWAVGSADNYMPGSMEDIITDHIYTLGTFDYAAGDYIVTWENIGQNAQCLAGTNAYLYMDGIEFKPVSEIPTTTLTAECYETTIRKYNSVTIPLSATVSDGTDEDLYGAEFVITPSTQGVADAKAIVNEKGKTELQIEGIGAGETTLKIDMKRQGTTRASISVDVTVLNPGVLTTVDVGVVGSELNTIPLHAINTDSNNGQLEVKIYDEDGVEIPEKSAIAQGISYTYASADESIAKVDPETGHVDALKAGEVEVICTVTLGDTTVVGRATLNVTLGKTRQSYYTAEKVAAARENAEKYSWARSSVSAYTRAADRYVGEEERLWNLFTSQELPRSYYVGYRADPDGLNAICRYCGVSITAKYGSYYAWNYDAWNDPWKVQCPDCRRRFPSNDFGGFYEIGIDENGNWRYELAKQRNAELVAAGEDGYLKNILYPEKGEGWGVDDGYGYKTGKLITSVSGNMIEETHTYISFYNYWALYSGLLYPAITNLEQAYLYTGDVKYGRAGAIMIDRLADLYPDYDTNPYMNEMAEPAIYTPNGVFTDYVWENQYATEWARAYDSLWPMYEDEYVIDFLSEKAEKYNLANDKSTPTLIRTNCEDGLLREMWIEAKKGNIWGNFGMFQDTISTAAVVLDTLPETANMLDWVLQDGDYNYLDGIQVCEVTGGNVLSTLINNVDRDGSSDEIAPNYTVIWVNGVRRIANTMEGYDKYPSADLYNNPRYVKMMTYQQDLILRRKTTPSLGDSGATALDSIYHSTFSLIPAFKATKEPLFAQMLYFLNGNKSTGLHYDAFTKDPNRLEAEVQAIIDEYGEWDFDQSTNLTDMGFAALRDGSYYNVSGSDDIDTQRAFTLYYGRSSGHGHHDALNLGIEAFGLSLAPDFGYPASSGGDDYTNWGHSTVQHNTVMVNDASQSGNLITGVPYHFDDDGRVSIIDADAAHQNESEKYRRTVVMVNVDNENSYGVDFFHVKGGSEHVYAFHALSDTIAETTGLENLKPQTDKSGNYIGSYAGADIPWKTMGNRSGYTYLYNVDRAANVGDFSVDFKIEDFRDVLDNEGDIRLRMTMLNSFELNEVAIASGDPPARDKNPQGLKFVLARRSGTNLDTLFTTVFEPYEDNRYVSNMQAVPVKRADGADIAQDEHVRAVKVELANGRVDYIVYAQNNTVEYVIDDTFNMRGFVGVYSIQDGENIYRYVNDGDKIGETTGLGTVTGKVTGFSKDLVFDNYIDVTVNEDIDAQRLIGEHIYVQKEGTGVGNATYKILDVEGEGKNLSLYVGNATTIDSSGNDGYIYHMTEGADFRIPLTVRDDASPDFVSIPKRGVESGSELVFNVSATSPIDAPITYRAGTLPRGAQFDPETGRFAWIPDSAQVGNHVATFIASNGGLESILEVEIEVFNATGGDSPSAGVTTPGSMGPGSTTAPDDGKTDEENPDDSGNTGDTDDKTKRFIDLGNHKWAEDAIYRLVDLGVINGTSENTYSPGNAITRADFTTLIVRAFGFTAETTENFPDVESGKYYTDTIAIAKALGIVNGDSKGNFNPMASITRQDMMVIIARAASVAGIDLSGDVENSFPDMDKVSDYAKDAVELLISSGIIAGSNGVINPLGTTTRAEVAVVLDRLLK